MMYSFIHLYRILSLIYILYICTIYSEPAPGVYAPHPHADLPDPFKPHLLPKPKPDTPVRIYVWLKQKNIKKLETLLQHISEPRSPEYGKYLSKEEIRKISAPTHTQVKKVCKFFENKINNICRISVSGDMIALSTHIQEAEDAFNVHISAYMPRDANDQSAIFFRSDKDIVLPNEISDLVEDISLTQPIHSLRRRSYKQPSHPPTQTHTHTHPPTHSHTYKNATHVPPVTVLCDTIQPLDKKVTLSFVVQPDIHTHTRTHTDTYVNSISSFDILIKQSVNKYAHSVNIPNLPDIVDSVEETCVDRNGKKTTCVKYTVHVPDVPNYQSTQFSVRFQTKDNVYSEYSGFKCGGVWSAPLMTPTTLERIYGLPNAAIKDPRNVVCVVEFLEQYFNEDDLNLFFQETGVTPLKDPIILGHNDQLEGEISGGEAQLDIQYLMSLAPNATTWFWSVPGRSAFSRQEPFLTWLFEVNDLNDNVPFPLVYSISYGDDEATLPSKYLERINVEFLKMGLQGITILVASGDDGASGYLTRSDPSVCAKSMPEAPASSPYVTAIGGTQWTRSYEPVCTQRYKDSLVGGCHFEAEKACMSNTGGVITTGGGFSNLFDMPWYQKTSVDNYLTSKNSFPLEDSYFNKKGRGYPDISVYSNNYLVVMNRKWDLVHGTSASTPVVAAMVAHWNDLRLTHGFPPLGFINPLLYHINNVLPNAFYDVVEGDNKCGVAQSVCCEKGFHAARGWDAVSGLGTPRFDVINAYLYEDLKQRIELSKRMSFTSVSQFEEKFDERKRNDADTSSIICDSKIEGECYKQIDAKKQNKHKNKNIKHQNNRGFKRIYTDALDSFVAANLLSADDIKSDGVNSKILEDKFKPKLTSVVTR